MRSVKNEVVSRVDGIRESREREPLTVYGLVYSEWLGISVLTVKQRHDGANDERRLKQAAPAMLPPGLDFVRA